MVEVTLERIGPDRRETLSNLFQLYVHDFSDFLGERRFQIGEDGRFDLGPLVIHYWLDVGREPLLIRADGNIAGFALLDHEAHSGLPVDWNMGEFFVARHYRREGLGRRAALATLAARSGQWEIAVTRKNTPALSFWRGVAAMAAVGEIEELDRADDDWSGTLIRLRIA